MNSYLQFLTEDNGEETISFKDDIGFAAYVFNEISKEMYVGKVFLTKENRGLKNALYVKRILEEKAQEIGAKTITGTVFLNQCNKHKFIKKLSFYEYLGFLPSIIENNAVIVIKEL